MTDSWEILMNGIKSRIEELEKQQKEIEELKDTNKKLDKENQGLFELYNFNDSSLLAKILKDYKGIIKKQQKEIEKLEARKYMLNAETGEISQIPINNNYISKDKIKSKIEELENEKEKYFEKQVIQHEIDVLQSLLERE